MDFNGFIKECYLRSNPSVDLDSVSAENPIDCRDYKLSGAIFDGLVEKYAKNNDERLACMMWTLSKGPLVV